MMIMMISSAKLECLKRSCRRWLPVTLQQLSSNLNAVNTSNNNNNHNNN